METSAKQKSIIDRRTAVKKRYDKLPDKKKGVTAMVNSLALEHKVTVITIWDDIKAIKNA